MKISDTNKVNNIKPLVVTDVKGRILYLNKTAEGLFNLKRGGDISEIIDIDSIKKLSMFNEITEALPTFHHKYRIASACVSGEGINKRVTLTFYHSDYKGNVELKAERDILNVSEYVRLHQAPVIIELNDFFEKAKRQVEKTNHFINLYLNEEVFNYAEAHFQSLLLCSISMMNEISPKKPVDVFVKRTGSVLEIKLTVYVKDIYPYAGIRLALIDAICNLTGDSYTVNIVDGLLKITLKLTEKKESTVMTHSVALSIALWDNVYNVLKPREYVLSVHKEQD